MRTIIEAPYLKLLKWAMLIYMGAKTGRNLTPELYLQIDKGHQSGNTTGDISTGGLCTPSSSFRFQSTVHVAISPPFAFHAIAGIVSPGGYIRLQDATKIRTLSLRLTRQKLFEKSSYPFVAYQALRHLNRLILPWILMKRSRS